MSRNVSGTPPLWGVRVPFGSSYLLWHGGTIRVPDVEEIHDLTGRGAVGPSDFLSTKNLNNFCENFDFSKFETINTRRHIKSRMTNSQISLETVFLWDVSYEFAVLVNTPMH